MKRNIICKIENFLGIKVNSGFTIILLFCALYCWQAKAQGLAGAFLQNPQDAVESAFCGITPLHLLSSQVLFSNSSLIAKCPNLSLTVGASALGLGLMPNTNQFNFTVTKNIAVASLGLGVRSYAVSTTQVNERGQIIGKLNAADYDIAICSAIKIANANLGGTLHYLNRNVSGIDNPINNIYGVNSSTNGFTMGLSGSMNFNGLLLLGANINNIATQLTNSTTNSNAEIPVNMRLTGGYYFFASDYIQEIKTDASAVSAEIYTKPANYLYATIQTEISDSRKNFSSVWAFAAEYVHSKEIPFAFRAGVNTLGDLGLGLSLDYTLSKSLLFENFGKNITIDFAARKEYYLNDFTMHFTLGFK